ncbi:response regulator transcription factor [Marixanthomonas sp. SCSIO 43207]|uniref:response regulator transcription factor n=1 Tax=Marixanthomonas sp. SCSIO 43207 TaxID=2779360 RepID=UPI001CA877DC|nr:response regulator transcription factor [Marixanthomonas sp. SCSIO 43207]UAB81761.1 response regulator transcription factor [Marixanthomonas sp. SCSIO 43207]
MIDKDFTIVIADDHPMLLSGLNEELTRNGYNVIGQANNGAKALDLILKLQPDIALLDIDMPLMTGLEVIKTAKEKNSETKFVILSFHREPEYVVQAKALQIDGYLLKEDSFVEIDSCMETVLSGREYFSNSFDTASLDSASEEMTKLKTLTPSEVTILKLIASQKNTVEIAEELFVSTRTVEKHRSNIIDKLLLEKGTNTLTNWALLNRVLISKI